MMAVQEIKSSLEYVTICNHAKKLSDSIQALCK